MNATATIADPTDLELEEIPRTQARPANLPSLAVNSPAALMVQALGQGADLERVEKMLELQERWERREAEKAYNDAMAGFSAEAIEIIKNKQVDYANSKGGRTQYKHAELSGVVEAVKPALARHGFSYRWNTTQRPDWLEVTCILKHRLGHFETCTLGGPPDDSGGKNRIQAVKSTKSYLERQTLEAICGVAEKGEDNDGQGAQEATAPAIPPELLKDAQDAAMGGWKALAAWIKSRTPQERLLLDPESDKLKAAAKSADAQGVSK
jgi:hypothetical protein